MSMIKNGESFNNAVVSVVDAENTCGKCGNGLNLLESSNGEVECRNCGYGNEIKDMETIDE